MTACVLYSWGARYELQVPPEVSAQEARQDQQQGLPWAGSGLPGGDRCRDGSEREKQSRVSVRLNRNRKQQFCAQDTVINAVTVKHAVTYNGFLFCVERYDRYLFPFA